MSARDEDGEATMSPDDVDPPSGGRHRRTPPPGTPDAVAGAADALAAATEALTALDLHELDGAQAAWLASQIAEVTSRLSVRGAELLPVIEADGSWAVTSARSFPHWVARTHRVAIRTARQQVALGRALRDDLPQAAAAAAAGDITQEQAQTLARLAPTSGARRAVLVDPEHECNEAFLVAQARRLPVDAFTVLVRRWAALADPDADDRGYVEACDREHLELSRLGDGYHLAGWLTVEHGQQVAAALEAVTPVPAADDQRTTTQRRAQALADLARVGLDHGLVGTGRAVRPRINVLVGYDSFTRLVEAAAAASASGVRHGTPPQFTAATLAASRANDGEAEDGPTACPQLEDGTPIPRLLLDRLACDSEINRVIFGPQSQVLDVGRTERTFTGPRRTALIARDKHCQYPTCTAPPALSEGHHVEHWARDRGATSVDNGILLCWHHHDLVHRRHIEIRRRDGRWIFTDRHGEEIGGLHAA